jgi:hypothetical protein
MNHGLESDDAVEQGDEADQAGASDGASQLIWKDLVTSLVRGLLVVVVTV